jgi:molybdopterin synthase catalytic subunit
MSREEVDGGELEAVAGAGEFETHCSLTFDVLNVSAAHDRATLDSTGATCLFVGTTRDVFEGHTVVRLEYEAYATMALKEMISLCGEARAQVPWGPELRRIIIAHRLGNVPVREASVVIAVSSPHRAPALAALSYLIDSLKARVPVWKKEVYCDAASEWKANKEAVGVAARVPTAP